ncbi:MAG: methyltransferase domain-containing protein [Vicinamibacterales bacterium]
MPADRFAHRIYQHEILDDHEPEQAVVDTVYAFLAMVNRRFGGAAATIARFEVFSARWKPGERIEVLDIASGAADIPRAIIAWGRARGFDVRVTALDISRSALDYARRGGPHDDRLRLLCADIRQPFCRDQAFDYVTSALFFHHLNDDEVVDVLRISDRIARRGLVVNDLVRSRQAWLLTWLLTWPFHPILHHDGPLSVRRALTPAEMLALADRAGISWLTVDRHFGERMTVAGERTQADRR